MRYSRGCAQYSDFLERAQLFIQTLLKQGYTVHHDLTVTKYPYLR
jgi:hypothetical protein